MTEHILIVEDEEVIRSALKRMLERNSYQVSIAESVSDATSQYNLEDFNLIISDLRLPGKPGTDLIRLAESTPVLIMTSYASLKSAVDSLKKGAADYIAKPFNHDEMLNTIQEILNTQQKTKALQSTNFSGKSLPGMIGNCREMQTLYHHIRKVAPTNSTVLVHGETGTGKELVAKAIHSESHRSGAPFVAVNCAAIPDTLIESELFGYEKGAFTGAQSSRIGLIEAANTGTLFLDEIGELPLEAQARLLRFIQENEIRRIGSTESSKVDVRLITATHRDLKQYCDKGLFRQDLFYRVNVIQLTLPPLRERGKDILEIAEHLLQSCAKRFNRTEQNLYFSPEAIQAITTYTWPGNIRELENAIERAVILSETPMITNDLLCIDLELVDMSQLQPQSASQAEHSAKKESEDDDSLSLEDYFMHFVLENQDTMSETELAEKLGISRKSLWERRKKLGIPRSKA